MEQLKGNKFNIISRLFYLLYEGNKYSEPWNEDIYLYGDAVCNIRNLVEK